VVFTTSKTDSEVRRGRSSVESDWVLMVFIVRARTLHAPITTQYSDFRFRLARRRHDSGVHGLVDGCPPIYNCLIIRRLSIVIKLLLINNLEHVVVGLMFSIV
jgi:hypothetical protein